MGTPKYALRLGQETLLRRICRILNESLPEIVIVGAPGQEFSGPESNLTVLYDKRPGEGPLAGIERGLSYLAANSATTGIESAFVTSCDTPFISQGVVNFLVRSLADFDAVAVTSEGRIHPLCAVYRVRLEKLATRLLDEGERRPRVLLESARTRFIDAESLRQMDPRLDSLRNVNTPEEYRRAVDDFEALQREGFV